MGRQYQHTELLRICAFSLHCRCYAEAVTEPGNSALDGARAAFDRGDFATARRLCRELERSSAAAPREQALGLRKQLEPDVAEVAILVGCLLFFGFTVWKYFF